MNFFSHLGKLLTMMISYATSKCIFGYILVAKSSEGICAIFLGDSPNELVKELEKVYPKNELVSSASLGPILEKILHYLTSANPKINLKLDIKGTTFQRKIWEQIMLIPYGETISYKNIAQKIGMPKAVRAVANACGANLISILIPCHRVVKSDGSLSGYRWGIERKKMLLLREVKGYD